MKRDIKSILRITLAVFAVNLFASCNENLVLTPDEEHYDGTEQIVATVKNQQGDMRHTIEMRQEKIVAEFGVCFNQAATFAVDAELGVDPALLESYNKTHGTAYALYPEALITFEADGALLIAPHKKESLPVKVTLRRDVSLTEGVTYAVPIAVKQITPGIDVKAEGYILLVKVMKPIPSTDKGTGVITICYVECNSNNPLNAGEWTLARSGKPIVDIVNLFAANINYDKDSGRIYLNINSNLMHILNNRDKYIRPLQEKGIKVCLTILGNHDGSGVANLSDQTARDFAAQLKAVVTTYGLDGVDFDDEWSDYDKHPTPPGCVKRGPEPYARLCYETKRAMPDKLCTVYFVGACTPWPEQGFYGFVMPIDGVFAGDFVDYSYYAQYGAISTSYTTIKGMKKSQWGPTSLDMQDWPNVPNIQYCRNNGYGVQVIYDLKNANGSPYSRYKSIMDNLAKILYDDTGAVYSNIGHEVDW